MASLNDNYLKLKAGYLFPEIGRRVKAFNDANLTAAARLIRCGIGDVTEPLPHATIKALHAAVDDLATHERFKGYGPATGHEFVRAAIAQGDFRSRGMDIADDEIFLSDGSKPDASAEVGYRAVVMAAKAQEAVLKGGRVEIPKELLNV